jgi:Secretion system C-terminal sorting domain
MKKQLTMFLSGCFLLAGVPFASAQTYYSVGHQPQPAALVATAPSDASICIGNSIFMTGTATAGTSPYSYSWSPGTNLSSTTTDTTTANPTALQTYTFSVVDNRNCSASDPVTITVNALPTPTAGSAGTYCVGNTIALTSSGGVDYDWTGPNSYSQANTQNPSIINATLLMDGVYTVTVTNAAGCVATATTTVNVNDCTGLEEIKEIETVNLYPNPSDGDFNVSILFKNKPASVLLEFYNMNGQLIHSKNYQKPGTELNDNFHFNDAPAGNYFVRIIVGKHALTQTFIIK